MGACTVKHDSGRRSPGPRGYANRTPHVPSSPRNFQILRQGGPPRAPAWHPPCTTAPPEREKTPPDKGTPVARRGRKATGQATAPDGRATEGGRKTPPGHRWSSSEGDHRVPVSASGQARRRRRIYRRGSSQAAGAHLEVAGASSEAQGGGSSSSGIAAASLYCGASRTVALQLSQASPRQRLRLC